MKTDYIMDEKTSLSKTFDLSNFKIYISKYLTNILLDFKTFGYKFSELSVYWFQKQVTNHSLS